MKWIDKTIFCLLFLVAVPAFSGQAVAIGLGKDNPDTLIGTKSTDYSIGGFRLGLTHKQTWRMLEKSNLFPGERSSTNPSLYLCLQSQC